MAGTPAADDDLFVSINLSNDFSSLSNKKSSQNESDADDESSNQRSFDSVESSQPGWSVVEDGLDSPFVVDEQNLIPESNNFPDADSDEDILKKDDALRLVRARQKLKLTSVGSSNSTSSTNSDVDGDNQSRKRSAVDGLLFEIYERYSTRETCKSIDSDNITECSTTSSTFCFASSLDNDETRVRLDKSYLETKDLEELALLVKEMRRSTNMMSSKLVRLLKQRDRNAHKLQQNFDMLTAILQAVSLKRRVDTRIRFSFIPSPGKKGFRQWHDAFKSVVRLSDGIPPQWRKRTWVSLAEYCVKDQNWNKVRRNCFNDRRNPEDDELDTQIVKDLHRTGCSWFFESDTEGERASLKRVLLAYARWNKSVGYCQGFNVIAALILQVVEGNEEEALKVMIYLVDFILPRNYFANNLRALSADMAVLRELMSIKLPQLAKHLDNLQRESIAVQSQFPGNSSYEPPLVNVFTMQWFLTLFATCLPRETVLRIWDAVLLEGSEVLLRVALAIWAILADYLDSTKTAADFYLKMGSLLSKMMDEEFISGPKLMETVFTLAPFPYRKIVELREKFTYDIHPFSTFGKDNSNEKSSGKLVQPDVISDEDGNDSEADNGVVGCLGFLPISSTESLAKAASADLEKTPSKNDIAAASPGAVDTDPDSQKEFSQQRAAAEKRREKENLDINHLQKQYMRMRKLQKKNMLVFNGFTSQTTRPKDEMRSKAINHLFIDLPNFEKDRRKKRVDRYPFTSKIARANSANRSQIAGNSSSVISEVGIRKEERVDPGGATTLSYSKVINATETQQVETLRTKPSQDQLKHKVAGGDLDSNDSFLDSSYFRVDRKALYPINFKPFPQRSQVSKSKLLMSNQATATQSKQTKGGSSAPVR
ncbi:TBC1 domain family member 30-like isoform X2 [Rhopilema esculentum]|uniref:TBC1 domain family member 30-like isoform X2 n=1 Tax=Rhopilema esculentum TaxID=499914 RepID=UPI0031D4820D